ncbi:MAG: hypothetical protein ACI855_002166 [Myxococcota bacterium]|jgi:hypothetical protein
MQHRLRAVMVTLDLLKLLDEIHCFQQLSPVGNRRAFRSAILISTSS